MKLSSILGIAIKNGHLLNLNLILLTAYLVFYILSRVIDLFIYLFIIDAF